MKAFIIIDMQNDFITGALANKDAEAVLPKIADYMENELDFHDYVYATRDTHTENYFNTQEGRNLPIKHCVYQTKGWEYPAILDDKISPFQGEYIDKPTFGYIDWKEHLEAKYLDEIVLCGTCTDICVVSNVLILKALFPETKVTVLKDLCAGLTPEKHEAALDVMRSCQVNVI